MKNSLNIVTCALIALSFVACADSATESDEEINALKIESVNNKLFETGIRVKYANANYDDEQGDPQTCKFIESISSESVEISEAGLGRARGVLNQLYTAYFLMNGHCSEEVNRISADNIHQARADVEASRLKLIEAQCTSKIFRSNRARKN